MLVHKVQKNYKQQETVTQKAVSVADCMGLNFILCEYKNHFVIQLHDRWNNVREIRKTEIHPASEVLISAPGLQKHQKSTNWIKGFMEHPNFLVCDKYERSYIHLKSVENPNFPGSEAEIVCQIQDFYENLSSQPKSGAI